MDSGNDAPSHAASSPAPIEVEAKFSFVDGRAFNGWLTRGGIAGFTLGPVATKRTVDEYLDSAARACMAAGYACRIRTSAGTQVATLKSLADQAAAGTPSLRRREELEVTLGSAERREQELPAGDGAEERLRQPAAWPPGPARDLALRLLQGEPLHHLAWIYQDRHERDVRDGERHVAALSLDQVRFTPDQEPMLELEVELSPGGTEDDLQLIVAELSRDPAFAAAPRSKLGRALDAAMEDGSGMPALGAMGPEKDSDRDVPDVLDVLLDGVAGVADFRDGDHRLLSIAREALSEAEAATPGLGPVTARDALLAGAHREISACDRPVVAAAVSLQSVLRRALERPPKGGLLGSKRLRKDPAYAALSPESSSHAVRLAVLLATAGRLTEESPAAPLFALTLTERRLVLSTGARDGGGNAAQALRPLWRDVFDLDLELEAAGPDQSNTGLRFVEQIATAGRRILRIQLDRLRRAVAALDGGEGDRVEALHDARVATRRMRTLLGLLKDAYPRRERGRHRRALARAGDRLGAVRDLDVLLGALGEQDGSGQPDEGAGALVRTLVRERDEALQALEEHLASARFRSWEERFERFLAASSLGGHGERRVCDAVPAIAWRRYGEVRAYALRTSTASLADLHELRKSLKKLRYLLEFFLEVLGTQAPAVIELVVGVQDALGELHDADVLRARIVRARRGAAAAEETLSALELRTAATIVERRRAFEALWPAIVDRRFRRRMAKALADL